MLDSEVIEPHLWPPKSNHNVGGLVQAHHRLLKLAGFSKPSAECLRSHEDLVVGTLSQGPGLEPVFLEGMTLGRGMASKDNRIFVSTINKAGMYNNMS